MLSKLTVEGILNQLERNSILGNTTALFTGIPKTVLVKDIAQSKQLNKEHGKSGSTAVSLVELRANKLVGVNIPMVVDNFIVEELCQSFIQMVDKHQDYYDESERIIKQLRLNFDLRKRVEEINMERFMDMIIEVFDQNARGITKGQLAEHLQDKLRGNVDLGQIHNLIVFTHKLLAGEEDVTKRNQ